MIFNTHIIFRKFVMDFLALQKKQIQTFLWIRICCSAKLIHYFKFISFCQLVLLILLSKMLRL